MSKLKHLPESFPWVHGKLLIEEEALQTQTGDPGNGQAQRWSLHGIFWSCKSLRQLSTNQSSWGTEKGSREQSAVLVMGRAAPILLTLLSASATTCSTQDTCPGECHTSPAAGAWGRLFSLPTWHKGRYKALEERGGFFLLCTFLIQL